MARPAWHVGATTPTPYGPYGDHPRRQPTRTTTTTMTDPDEDEHETINLDDIDDHIKRSHASSRLAPQRTWSRRESTKNYIHVAQLQRSPDIIDDDGFSQEWPRYTDTRSEKRASAFPSPLRPGFHHQHHDANFLHPPTPEAQEQSFDRKRDSFNDTVQLTGVQSGNGSGSGSDKSTSPFVWWTLGLWLLAALMVTLTTVYSTGSAKALMKQSFFVASSSNSILVLRVMTELCAIIMAGLIVVCVEDLQWALASRPQGISLLHFVGLDSGTGVWGLLRLLATAEWRQKYSSLFRLLVICSIPVPGVILMGAISIEMVTFPEKTYPVSAGIAPFNASNIYHVKNSTATALLVQMGSPAWSDRDSFSLDPLHQGVGKCSGLDGKWAPCDESHLITGGVVSVAPQADDLKQFPGASSFVVPHTRVVQLEYGKVPDLDKLRSTGRCALLGSVSAASYWCSAVGDKNGLLFGSAYCPISLQTTSSCISNQSWTEPLELSSSLFVYSRHATITYDRGNFSILAVTDMTPAVQDVVSLDDYMLALSAVVPGFNSSNANTGKDGDNSALAIYAVTALPINDGEVAKRLSLKAVRKAMSVPFSYFHANYFAEGPSIWELKGPRPGMPEDMYTDLSISVLSHQVVAGRVSRVLFVLVSGAILGLSAAIIVATSRVSGKRPERCGYPTLDFAAVCAVKGMHPPPGPPGPGPGTTAADGGGGADWSGAAGDRERQEPGPHTLHKSLTQLGQKPKPFEVAKNIMNERVIIS